MSSNYTQAQAQAQALHPDSKIVSPSQVFNLSLYSYFCVVDARQEAAYIEGHVCSSSNHPPPPVSATQEEREESLFRYLMKLHKNCMAPEHFTPVVLLCDPGDPASVACVSWLSHRYAEMRTKGLSISKLNPGAIGESTAPETNGFQSFISRLTKPENEVWVLDGGFQNFAEQYPGMISTGAWLSDKPSLEDIGPTPRQITANIWLGARNFPDNTEALRRWGITHILCEAEDQLNPKVLMGLEQKRKIDTGIVYLRCNVKDNVKEDHIPCFRVAADFFDDVITKQGRVLVYLHGRSRSASIICAWLIIKRGLTAKEALAHVEDVCEMRFRGGSSALDHSLMLLDQLAELEKETTRFLTSA